MSSAKIAVDALEKQTSAHWSVQDSQRDDAVKSKTGRSPLGKTALNNSPLSTTSFTRDSVRASWKKRVAALKPRTRLYLLFACVQAIMLGSWLLASFARAQGM
jgi:hypothetical protein